MHYCILLVTIKTFTVLQKFFIFIINAVLLNGVFPNPRGIFFITVSTKILGNTVFNLDNNKKCWKYSFAIAW